MNRGYCGIAFLSPKYTENVGGVFRNAHAFGANFIAIIGKKKIYTQASDTTKAERHIPVFYYVNIEDFINHIPNDCQLVCVEVDGVNIATYRHPERAIYLFGGESETLPLINNVDRVCFDTKFCLNMATTSALVLYDRQIK